MSRVIADLESRDVKFGNRFLFNEKFLFTEEFFSTEKFHFTEMMFLLTKKVSLFK